MDIYGPDERRLAQTIEAYESVWDHDSWLKIEEDVAAFEEESRLAAAWELVHVDLEFALKAGLDRRIEFYLRLFPDLANDSQRLAELIRTEFSQRRRNEPTLSSAEYLERFPDCAKQVDWSSIATPARTEQDVIVRNSDPRTSTDRFEIVRCLGEGGLGKVWLAIDHELGRQVAIKEIRPELAQDELCRSRFLQEASITARIGHPGVVPVHDLGEDLEGRPYYVMPYIEGETLKDAIRSFHKTNWNAEEAVPRTVALRRLLGHFQDVCNTIEFAHQRGVIHRDLKPANIMVGSLGQVVVVDWGLAKSTNEPSAISHSVSPKGVEEDDDATVGGPEKASRMTTLGSVLGSPAYMSPEQARGEHHLVDARSDVYSLGAVLFEILTGAPPISGDSSEELVGNARQGAAHISRKPTEVDPTIAKPISAICQTAMAPCPDDRYQTAGKLAGELERFLADEPVVAYPEGAFERWTRLARSHRAAINGIGAVLVIAALVSTAAALMIGNKNRQLTASNRRLSRVTEFFVDIFDAEEPIVDGRDLRVADAMTVAVERVPTSLESDPQLSAILYRALANVLLGRGAFDEGLECAKRAVVLHAEMEQTDLEEKWRADHVLAAAHLNRDEGVAAIQILEPLVIHRNESLGKIHPESIAATIDLVDGYNITSRLSDARRLSEEVLRLAEETPDFSLRARIYNVAGSARNRSGKRREAAALMSASLDDLRVQLPPDSSALQQLARTLANVYSKLQEYDKAIAIHEDAYAESVDRLGPDHPNTLIAMANLGSAYWGDYLNPKSETVLEKAKSILEDAVDRGKAVFGEAHIQRLAALNSLANCLRSEGSMRESCKMLEQIRHLRIGSTSERDQFALLVSHNLARTYAALGEFDKGIELMSETLRLRIETLGPNHEDIFHSTDGLGAIYEYAGRLDEAADCYRRALAMDVEVPTQHGFLHDALTGMLLKQNKYEEAEEAIKNWNKWLKLGQGTAEEPIQRDAMLGEVRAAKQEFEVAARLLSPFVTDQKFQMHYRAMHFESIYGMCLGKLGKTQSAEEHLLGAERKMRDRGDQEPEFYDQHMEATRNLVEFYEANDQTDQVEEWSAKLVALEKRGKKNGGDENSPSVE